MKKVELKKIDKISLSEIKKDDISDDYDLDTIAINSAFMPNLIHSLDSANFHILVNNNNLIKDKININLFTIHDCFASSPETLDIINIEVRKAFSMMYFNQDYLLKLHESF